jgi:hypothetical protein
VPVPLPTLLKFLNAEKLQGGDGTIFPKKLAQIKPFGSLTIG